jgi:hypothetical protein
MIFFIIFRFHVFFLSNFIFLFCFLVEVGFLIYLKLFTPSKKENKT